MNKPVGDLKPEAEVRTPLNGLALLRKEFPDNQISKLPKPLAKREDMDKLPKAKCAECGGYHATSKIIHLDYVGHAAATDRLLDADPEWSWEPMALTPEGLPLFDKTGGLWIRLTVCGVTRIGYGSADGKTGGDAIKEIIGDALRNSGMRFGMALDLWHKGDLHAEPEEPAPSAEERAIAHLRACAIDKGAFKTAWEANKDGWKGIMDAQAYARVVAEMKRLAAAFPKDPPPPADDLGIGDDQIPF